MDSVLIVTSTEKSVAFFRDLIKQGNDGQLVTLASAVAARRMLQERDFDLVVINAPLRDESGENLAVDIVRNYDYQVILIVKAEFYDAVAAVTEVEGILTLPKPLQKNLFWSALRLASASANRLKSLRNENQQLSRKIEDIRIIDRAKYVLITHLKMTEKQAHRYIEKQAMNMRKTRRAIAESILRTYDD